MTTFISPHLGMKLFLDGKLMASFVKGVFRTDEEKAIKFIKAHPDFGKTIFNEGNVLERRDNVVVGIRNSSANTENLDNVKAKYLRLGELTALVLKDGELKKTASKILVDEFQQLKKELGE